MNAAQALPTGIRVASLCALLLAGCDEAAESRDGTEVQIRDSAGIRIVEYAGTPSVPTLTRADEPLYTHGTGPDDYQFASIGGAVLYPDGSAAVFDWGNREIILLGPDGAFRNVLARQGDGPGEISQFGGIALTAGGADTLLVADDWKMLLTLFAGGAVARNARPLPGDAVARAVPKAIGDDGRILMASVVSSNAPTDYRAFAEPWRSGHMVLYDLSTQVAETVARYDWIASSSKESSGHMEHVGRVGAAGGEFVYGRSDVPQLVWRRTDGTVRQIMRWEPEWLLTSDENWDPFITCMRSHVRTLMGPSATEERIEDTWARWDYDPSRTYPLFGWIRGDNEGRLWLENRWQSSCYPRRLTAIGPDGVWLGVFEPPEGFMPLHMAGGRVLGTVRDDLGVQSVAVYELVGGERGE